MLEVDNEKVSYKQEENVIRVKNMILELYSIHNTILPDDKFVTDCARIGAFLMDVEAVHAQLARLNILINDQFKEKNWTGIFNETNEYRQGAVKVLREILEKELAKFGFQPQFAQVLDMLSPEEFNKILSDGLILKDTFFRDNPHGEFAHAIQWFLIASQVKENKLTLSHNIIDIYKNIGKNVRRQARNGPKTIWDVIVDMAQDFPKPVVFFRSPEYLTNHICEHKTTKETEINNISLLQEIVKHRGDKKRPSSNGEDKIKFFKQQTNGKYTTSDISESVLVPWIKSRVMN